MKTRVVTVSVTATAAGSDLAVNGATLSLGVNAIPSVELQCAPSKTGSRTPLRPNVKRPRISDFSDLYGTLASKAEGLNDTGDVTIEVKDDQGKTDSVKLSGWILAGVGLSSVSASSAPYLSVVLQHPICKLTKVGSIYETPKSTIDKKLNEATSSASDFLGVVEAAYKCVRDEVEFWPSPNEYPPKFRQQLGVGEFDPKTYLEFRGGNGIFLGSGSGAKERLAQAMGRFALPGSGGSSTWDMLVSASGQLLLSVTQDESNNFTTKKLNLEPTQPWKTASITLSDDRCFWTELPGMNPLRITGVMASKLGPYCDAVSLGMLRNGNPKEDDKAVPGEVLYVPIENPTVADGRIMKTAAPAILDSAFRRDAPHGGTITTGTADMDKERKDGYNEALEKYCKAVYEITAGSMIHAKAQMALWFKDKDGRLILPGNTCRFTSEGKDIYYGYIREVVHHMSTSGGCSTTVSMSYVRPTPGFEVAGQTAIAAGSKNAAYE